MWKWRCNRQQDGERAEKSCACFIQQLWWEEAASSNDTTDLFTVSPFSSWQTRRIAWRGLFLRKDLWDLSLCSKCWGKMLHQSSQFVKLQSIHPAPTLKLAFQITLIWHICCLTCWKLMWNSQNIMQIVFICQLYRRHLLDLWFIYIVNYN